MVIDNVIITLTCEGNDFDMELPANVKISQLKPLLQDALRKKGINISNTFDLTGTDGYLSDSDTLFNAGIWDGRNLTIV